MLSAFGYPAAAPYNGSDLVYSRGPVSFDTLNGNATYGMTSNLTGGASGGPWVLATNYTTYADASIRSLNSYKYNFNKNAMYGPKFNSSTRRGVQRRGRGRRPGRLRRLVEGPALGSPPGIDPGIGHNGRRSCAAQP